ncbi:MAG: phosphoribosylamine--glycine ligase [Spirochaetaceae bacterium]|jgi:phosphoribosylamine--glycine ligase|nr:phosphoribosylamine--glycine ligase [Spirochaetaceae bacterium]
MKNPLNIAIIGSGGREHAIIKKLKKSPKTARLTAIPGNAGIERDGVPCHFDIDPLDVSAVTKRCKSEKFDYVVVTPDNPLALGMVDELNKAGIRSFGPERKAALIESSKIFAKDLMKEYNIPTADYAAFSNGSADALKYTRESFASGKEAVVVKADGLALGKGVTVCFSLEEAEAAIRGAMDKKLFGKSGESIIIEEYLTGTEVSVLSFCDGSTVVPMASAMDHKRALNGDAGANTGGMGCIAPNPFYLPEIADLCKEKIFDPTIEAVKKEAAPFKGCLYFGLMLTEEGPKVIEYNCRFGDPETQAVLPLLESDLLSIMTACTDGTLTADMVRFMKGASSACVVAASKGYPAKYETGFQIKGLEASAGENLDVYCAGVELEDGVLVTSGGRVLCVSAVADSLEQAIRGAYGGLEKIEFENKCFRTDIGEQALKRGISAA